MGDRKVLSITQASMRSSTKAAPGQAPVSGAPVLQLLEIELGRTTRKVEHLDADHLVVLVEVQHHARRDFFGLDDLRIIQSQVERVGFFIDV